MKNKTDKRFDTVYEESPGLNINAFKVFRDNVTGVQYLFYRDGNSSGLTPLLDKDGKVAIEDMNQ